MLKKYFLYYLVSKRLFRHERACTIVDRYESQLSQLLTKIQVSSA